MPLFEKEQRLRGVRALLDEALEKHPTRLLAYAIMPNHWHLLLWPRQDGELTDFLRWLTHTHTMRWHAHHGTGGTGHFYQGRFKSFPIQHNEHYYTVARYVEQNALRAGLVERAKRGDGPAFGADAKELRRPAPRLPTGRSPDPPTGCKRSTACSAKATPTAFAPACARERRSSLRGGSSNRPCASASKPPSAPADDPRNELRPISLSKLVDWRV